MSLTILPDLALYEEDLPECTKELMVEYAENFYQNFKATST